MPSENPVVHGGADITHMGFTGGAGRKAYSYRFGHGWPFL